MRRMSTFCIGLAVLAPSLALAKTIDALTNEVDQIQTLFEQSAADEVWMQQEVTRENGTELFPLLPNETATEDPIPNNDPFVTFLEYGVKVELKDVPRQAWFAPYVRDVAERGIVSGYRDDKGKPLGEFRPEKPVSIEELSKMLLFAIGKDTTTCTLPAKNILAKDRWSESFIACAEQGGWILFSDGTTDLVRPATRSEVVVTLLQAFGVSERDIMLAKTAFTDVSTATPFASAILTAADDGIIGGYTDESGEPTGMFGPDNSINRAEVAKMISIALQTYGK